MTKGLKEFGIQSTRAPVAPESECYRPPSWPPPPNWVVSTDTLGRPLSRWSDAFWDFSHWVGKSYKLWFGAQSNSRQRGTLTPTNEHLLRLAATWLIWGPRGPRSWVTIKHRFLVLRRIFALCSSAGISAAELVRYPVISSQLLEIFPSQQMRGEVTRILDYLLLGRDWLGFVVLDEVEIARLFGTFSARRYDASAKEQSAYIPPRIWTYQTQRLRECLDDFNEKRSNIEDCFKFCVAEYAHNFGSLTTALMKSRQTPNFLPFTEQRRTNAGARTGRRFHGRFELTARRFEIDDLLDRWVCPRPGGISIRTFSAYLTLVTWVGLTYIANFTLQRRNEVGALRADCLSWETDPILGRIPIICGPTTKTDPDSDARWPTSPSVQVAVDVMTSIARLRVECAAADPAVRCSEDDIANPYLFHRCFEPWAGSGERIPYTCQPNVMSYQSMLERFPRLLDTECIRITDDDLQKALMFTPGLDTARRFRVGEPWPFAYHQLRRTGAVNMFASGLVSDSSIQDLLKHQILSQSRYYGRNYSHLRFSEELEKLAVDAKYEVMAKQIEMLVNDRFVSPLGLNRKEEVVVNLVGEKDFAALVNAGKKGVISFRETRLGGCTKIGPCEYGGIESISRCSGGDGDKPCRDAIYDCEKRASVEQQLLSLEHQLQNTIENGRRWQALQAEIRGLRNYLDVTART